MAVNHPEYQDAQRKLAELQSQKNRRQQEAANVDAAISQLNADIVKQQELVDWIEENYEVETTP